MHSNAATVGVIVGRTCAHRAFYEKERNLGGLRIGENSHKIMIQFSRWAVYVANIKMFGPKSVEL